MWRSAATALIAIGGLGWEYATAQANMTQVGDDVAIDLGGGQIITLKGTLLGSLDAGDFFFF